MIITTKNTQKNITIDYDDYIRLNLATRTISISKMGYPIVVDYLGVIDKRYKYKHHLLHRLILNAKPGERVDHVNMNKLDNRKSNLRVCDDAKNSYNRKPLRNKFKGVWFHKKNKKWIATIRQNYKGYYLGSFDNEVDAAKAYNKAAIERFGRFAYLNDVN